MRRLGLAAGLCSLLLVAPLGAQERDGPTDLEAIERVLRGAREEVGPAVVRVLPARRPDERDPFRPGGDAGPPPGTGLIVDPAGWVVTTARVAGDVEAVLVELADGRRLVGRPRGRDLRLGLVLLRLEGADDPLPAARPVEAELRPGRICILLGAIGGSPGPTVDLGIVSATGRLGGRFFQTDLPLRPAKAGGPVLDVDGRVVGLAVWPSSAFGDASGVAFAVPGGRLAEVLPRLRDGETIAPAFLGVRGEPAGSEGRGGIRVAETIEGTAAARAGLAPGDVIRAVGEVSVRVPADLRRAIAGVAAGDRVVLTFRRDGELVSREAVLGPPPDAPSGGTR